MGESAAPGPSGSNDAPYLTFRVDGRLFALPAGEVSEVIRTPSVARIPQGPKSLLGVANLRGVVLPVASLRGLLGLTAVSVDATSRAVVLNGPAPVALAVDKVEALTSVNAGAVRTGGAGLSAETGESLRGAFQVSGGSEFARILDIQTLLAAAFVQRPRPVAARRAGADMASRAEATDSGEKLVTFEVAGQAFALALCDLREILPVPADIAAAPRSEALVLGVVAYRNGLLPLLSLRGLLGFPLIAVSGGRERVVVTRVGGVLVGLVVDRMLGLVPADPSLVEPTPPLLAARAGGEARIKAIYRGDGGRRLISILSPEQLFGEDVMQRLGHVRAGDTGGGETTARDEHTARLLIFRLGDDEFGLPIDSVDEVAAAPTGVTRLPRTPAFLEGVMNLRGEVLPVVDQRKRFDMPALADGSRRRLIVVRTARHRAGLIVDSVSEVLTSAAETIEAAPELTGEATRLVTGVINLTGAGRMVMVLDPAELLSRAERGLLDAFKALRGEPGKAAAV